jgi:2',3'-cyclic-nucleotide 2'-phosphodiesterase (5'-nucleotidase family)
VTVLYVADLHAQLESHPEVFDRGGPEERTVLAGGFARLATAIEEIRAERGDGVLVVDGGDTLQGSGAGALTEGAAVVGALAPLGIDVGVPGNWEVAYGPGALRRRARELGHPLIASNLRDGATGEREFPPLVVREVAGVRVAVVGFTDPDVPRRQPPAYSEGLRYDGPEALPALVAGARADGAEIVLLTSHVGLPKALALTPSVPGVDVHLSADTHERTVRPIDVGGTWVVEPGAFGSFLGRLDLWVRDGKVVDRRWELIEVTAERFAEHPATRRAVDAALAPHRARLDAPVGQTAVPLLRYDVVETSLDAVLADALRETTGTEVALSNGFRFGSPILPGPIRESDLWNVYPVVSRLKTGRVSGRQLRDFWERELENVFAADPTRKFGGWVPRPSGMTVRFEVDAPRGHRVRELTIGGQPVEDDRLYAITACDREGDAPDTLCRIPHARDVLVLDVDAHEAVRRYLRRHDPVVAPPPGRVVALDRPGPMPSQVPALAPTRREP